MTYQKGILQRALTRGDGSYGEDVTHTVCKIKNIPQRLKTDFSGEISGEVFFYKQDFAILNQQTNNRYANARNTAAGAIRRISAQEAILKYLTFLPYSLFAEQEVAINNQQELYQYFQKQGFKTENQAQFCENLADVHKFIQT